MRKNHNYTVKIIRDQIHKIKMRESNFTKNDSK